MFFAHSTNDSTRANWQSLIGHLHDVSDIAAGFGARLGISEAARLAGLLHDLGKYSPAFQARLGGVTERVDHSTAGAALVLQLASGDDRIIADLIAYAIAGHHAGLPDRQGESRSTLSERLAEYSQSPLAPEW